jgi:uncharacterized Zn-finger protein
MEREGAGLGNRLQELVMLPLDRNGFLRRECPHCRRQFKVRGGPCDGATIQRYLGRHLLFENPHEICGDDTRTHCPYCGRGAPTDEWCTPQQRAWLEKVAGVLGQAIRYQQLSYPLQTLQHNPLVTFVAVPPPDRLPEMRVEADDMRRHSFFCCVEEVKVEPAWVQPMHCPGCGSEHQAGPPRRARLPLEPAGA